MNKVKNYTYEIVSRLLEHREDLQIVISKEEKILHIEYAIVLNELIIERLKKSWFTRSKVLFHTRVENELYQQKALLTKELLNETKR